MEEVVSVSLFLSGIFFSISYVSSFIKEGNLSIFDPFFIILVVIKSLILIFNTIKLFGSYLNSISEIQRKHWKLKLENKGKLYTYGLFSISQVKFLLFKI